METLTSSNSSFRVQPGRHAAKNTSGKFNCNRCTNWHCFKSITLCIDNTV